MLKIFVVGEGETELGRTSWDDRKHEQVEEEGVAQILFRRLLRANGVTKEIRFVHRQGQYVKPTRLPKRPGASKIPSSGFAAKAYYAMVMAKYDEKCGGLIIFVDTDRDKDQDRCQELWEGIQCFHEQDRSDTKFPGVVGVAIHTVEAWLLADEEAFAVVCGKKRPHLPDRRSPEELWGERNNPDSHHPKQVLARILNGLGLQIPTELAEHIDLEVLQEECPQGFGELARAIVKTFVSGCSERAE